MSSLQDVIKTLRKDRGWSQAKLAKEAGLSRATINNAEKSRHGANATTLDKIAGALGLADAEELWLKGSELKEALADA
jgi:transcriptional regulator with XRE-family HTH domain